MSHHTIDSLFNGIKLEIMTTHTGLTEREADALAATATMACAKMHLLPSVASDLYNLDIIERKAPELVVNNG